MKFKTNELNTMYYNNSYNTYKDNRAILKSIEHLTQNIYLINVLNFLAGAIGLTGGLIFIFTL